MLEVKIEAWIAVCLFAGLSVAFFIARAISKFGLLNGFSVLTLLEVLRYSKTYANGGAAFAGVRRGSQPWTVLCAVLLLVVATVACFPASSVRNDQTERASAFALPVPASSMQPLAIVLGLFNFLALAFPEAMSSSHSWLRLLVESPWARAGLTLGVGMLLLWAFSRPRHVSAAFSPWVGEAPAGGLARRVLRNSIIPTLLFLFILALSESLPPSLFDLRSMVLLIPTAVVIVLDLVAAVQVHRRGAWACVWRDPRPYAFPVVERLLRGSDIPVRGLSLAQASLFRIFAPYALTEAWVPAPLAARASELIEGAFSAGGQAHSEMDASDLDEHPEHAAMRRKQLYQLAALAAVAALACVATVSLPR
jgi:hypothetical protein